MSAADQVLQTLKREPTVDVELLVGNGTHLVRKTYRTAPYLLWRTFLSRSKARREYDNLTTLHSDGIPCVRPVAWSEIRRFGFVRESAVTTEFAGSSLTLKELLAGPATSSQRRNALEACGRLLRQLHDGGLVSTTFYPRNVLIEPAVALCDQPHLVHRRTSAFGKSSANIDLYDAAFSPSRRHELSRVERFRLLLAYSKGDRATVQRIWRQLGSRSHSQHRRCKGLLLTGMMLFG